MLCASSVVKQSFVGFTATPRPAVSGTPEHDLTIGAAAEQVEVTKVMDSNCLSDFTCTVRPHHRIESEAAQVCKTVRTWKKNAPVVSVNNLNRVNFQCKSLQALNFTSYRRVRVWPLWPAVKKQRARPLWQRNLCCCNYTKAKSLEHQETNYTGGLVNPSYLASIAVMVTLLAVRP